jgi:GMP synthase (glutamine-hydrolysing)
MAPMGGRTALRGRQAVSMGQKVRPAMPPHARARHDAPLPGSTAQPLRVLLVNGYCERGRERLAANGCTDAAELYASMLKSLTSSHGVDLRAEVVYPVSEEFRLPSASELEEEFDAVAWTGSNLTIHADEPEVHLQLELARLAYSVGVPQFGSCWGMQVAAQSAGIATLANPLGREQGLARKMHVTAEGSRHPLYRGGPACFDGFTAHTDMVSLPSALASGSAGAECSILASNAWTPVQALAVKYLSGEFWGVQYVLPTAQQRSSTRACLHRDLTRCSANTGVVARPQVSPRV